MVRKLGVVKVVLVMLVVVLVLAGCGGGDGGDQPPADQPAAPSGGQQSGGVAASPTPEVAEPAGSTSEEDLNVSDLTEGLAGLSSYRSRFSMSFSGKDAQGQPADSSWVMEEDFVREPRAQRTAMTSTGSSAGQAGALEMITIGDMSYWITTEDDGTVSCTSMSSGDDTGAQQGLFTPDMLGGISDAKYVGTDTVNGVRAKHYTWKESTLPLFGFGSVEGEAWTAVDGEYVVKYFAQATGKGTLFGSTTEQEGTITFEYDLTDVNAPFTIEPPADCVTAATDMPIMANAEEKTTFGEMISYSSASPLADVVAFYEAEMPAAGWQASGEPTSMEGFATLEYTKEGRTAQLMLTYDSDAQKTSVIITTSTQE